MRYTAGHLQGGQRWKERRLCGAGNEGTGEGKGEDPLKLRVGKGGWPVEVL
jgi:hypothetical protein